MDIERLKELKEQIRDSHDGINGDDLNLLYDLLPLVDEAITRQSATSEDVAEAIDQVEGTRRKAQKELDSLIETKSRYDHQIEIGDPWNWKWEESWHPLAVEGNKQTVKNANLAIAALQAYQPTTRKDRIVEEVAISKTETTSEEDDTYSQCEECGQFYLDSRGYDYCPNCGRRLKGD